MAPNFQRKIAVFESTSLNKNKKYTVDEVKLQVEIGQSNVDLVDVDVAYPQRTACCSVVKIFEPIILREI
jgi:hypothetical protein